MDSKQLLNNLSSHLKNAIARAIAFSASANAPAVTPGHLLLAIAEEPGSIGAEALKKIQLTAANIRDIVYAAAPTGVTTTATLPQLSTASKQALEKAMLIAYERSHTYVGTEHLLYGLFHSSDLGIQTMLSKAGVSLDALEEQLDIIFQGTSRFPDGEDMEDLMEHMQHMVEQEETPLPLSPDKKTANAKNAPHKKHLSALDVFTTNLTSKEIQERIDPVIGREAEIERLIHILCRRTKNNPILVGEPGVGKTAIVEGLAKKIFTGDVPDILKRKKILSLDLALLIAGTIYRGEFEARLRQIIDEVSHDANAILFIDEIHNIIGAGSNSGTMDAANIMKPALARGLLRCIGATTIDEYSKHIKPDPALERRLQQMHIDEPSIDDTKKILRGIKSYYESFHNVRIDDQAIDAAVELSAKYVHDNYLPDKAIDLIDEAAARVRATARFAPVEKKIMEIEKALEKLEKEKEDAIHEEVFQKAMILKNTIQNFAKKLKEEQAKTAKKRAQPKQDITKKDIASVLGAKLHLDPLILEKDDWEALHTLPERLQNHVVGQETTVQKIVQKLRHAHLRLPGTRQPFASFLFAGPSGVGKTALAKALARELYHDPKALVQFDMTEFSEGHSVSKILGSPAGYVGYNERNRFTDEIRKRPYSVLLFDEFDKAHPDVRRLLLQILDEGELTDSHGKKINFTHSVIILTTNIGAELFTQAPLGFGASSIDISKDHTKTIKQKIKEEFGAALIGRLSDICLFAPLSHSHITTLVERQIAALSTHFSTTRQMAVATDPQAVARLARDHYTAELGARQVEEDVERVVHELVTSILLKPKHKKRYTLVTSENTYKLV